jgi:hypothetical protein
MYGPGRSLSASKHNAVSSVTTAVPSYETITPHGITSYQIRIEGRAQSSDQRRVSRVTGFGRYGTDLFGSGFAFGDGYLLCRPLDFRYYEQ